MGLERISQIILGVIIVLFLFAMLPTLVILIAGAGITDPVLQGAAFLVLFVFVIVTIYAAFKGESKPSLPSFPTEALIA